MNCQFTCKFVTLSLDENQSLKARILASDTFKTFRYKLITSLSLSFIQQNNLKRFATNVLAFRDFIEINLSHFAPSPI